jgi:signal recognition particle subunit SRP9
VKWKASEGKLVLKITDDSTVRVYVSLITQRISHHAQCLKFKTYSSIILNRFEALNLSLMERMQNRRVVKELPPPLPPLPTQAETTTVGEENAVGGSSTGATTTTTTIGTTGVASGGGVKKKKPKKKK